MSCHVKPSSHSGSIINFHTLALRLATQKLKLFTSHFSQGLSNVKTNLLYKNLFLNYTLNMSALHREVVNENDCVNSIKTLCTKERSTEPKDLLHVHFSILYIANHIYCSALQCM